MSLPPSVALCDVGPRDGLQNHPSSVPPETRAELCRRLAGAGLRRVEAGSLVSPRAVPQMARAEAVLGELDLKGDVVYSALVVNADGLRRALEAGVPEVHAVYPLTETFAGRNQSATVAEAAATVAQIARDARAAGREVTITLGVAFGCPFEGTVDPGLVVEHVRRMAAERPREIVLADTIGVAVPAQVRSLVAAALEAADGVPIGLHLHNTRNTGYANAEAGLEAGASSLDASVGGLGGCPFAPRATGNIATEDLVYMLDRSGVDTGIDLDELIRVVDWLEAQLGTPLPGLLHTAGIFPPA